MIRLTVILREGNDINVAFPIDVESVEAARSAIEAACRPAPAPPPGVPWEHHPDQRRKPRSEGTKAKIRAARKEWWRQKKAAESALRASLRDLRSSSAPAVAAVAG